ncbi:MAG: starch-binding protein [Eubacteriales bacterium]|nr:starch-binding protein [Eubacteriales bacterium]
MRKTKQLLCVLMMLTILVSSLPFSASALQTNDIFSDLGMGDLSLETENTDNPYVISTVDDYFELKDANQTGKKVVAVTGASTLPSSADNSQSPYFPVIDTQGSLNSCVPFASSYYQFTYEINRARKVTTTKDNSFSPKWTFNFLCHGTGSGTNYAQVYGILKQHGCPTLKTLPYDAKDYLSWSTDEKVWREAMRYRLADYQLFEDIGKDGKDITSPDDEDLLAIKTALSNGDILGCSTYITSLDKGKKKLKANANAPENDKYLNEQYLSALPSTEGGHRMTIVGYNDNLWCDINDNNAIDDGEMGALKVANSWGTNWGNKGFIWISYDSLNDVSCVEGVAQNSKRRRVFDEITRIDVSVNEGNDIYAKLTVNTANRSRFYAVFSASLHGSEYSRYMLDDARYFGTTDKHAFNGTTTACDATFLYPLNDLSPALTTANFEDYDFTITVKDGQDDPSTVIVKGVSLVNEYTGKEYKVNANYPITLNASEWSKTLKEKTTKNVVVYYIGFDEPNLHYKKSGSSTFTKVKMEENDERYGYLYKYVIEDTSSVDLYFSDDSGKIDNNSGNNYKAVAELNYYFTKGQHDALKITDLKLSNGTTDINKRCYLDFKTTGGYEPYQYKYTMEDLSTGETKTVNYTGIYANNPFRFEKETTYKVTVEAMDYAKQTTSSSILIEVTDQPLQIVSLAPDKPNGLVSKELTFTSITEFEGLMSGPHTPQSRFVIKDSSGKVWYDNIIKYSTANYVMNSTTTVCNYTPQKAGEYTLTVSLTDWYKEYTEKTINFTVYDMVYGDTDGNGTINIVDATIAQRFLASIITEDELYLEFADCDMSKHVNITDATLIQRYVAQLSGTENVGQKIDYTEVIIPTEPPTTPTEPTVKPTTPVTGNNVTFTNSLNWSGTLYCYYWSDSNTQMTTWPGKAMTKSGTNEYGETLYTFEVPNGAQYIIFTNGSVQTVDISYKGGVAKYYAQNSKTGDGYNVGTW